MTTATVLQAPEAELARLGRGDHHDPHSILGAHPVIGGTVVGAFDRWDGRLLPLRSMGASGVWELFVPGIGAGELYKYEILGRDGVLRLKADPFAFAMQVRPETASRVWDP